MSLGKQAACLRTVGEANPDPEIAALEQEMKDLGNNIGMGPMGFVGKSMVIDCHIEVGYCIIPVRCRSAFIAFACHHDGQQHDFMLMGKSITGPTPIGLPLI